MKRLLPLLLTALLLLSACGQGEQPAPAGEAPESTEIQELSDPMERAVDPELLAQWRDQYYATLPDLSDWGNHKTDLEYYLGVKAGTGSYLADPQLQAAAAAVTGGEALPFEDSDRVRELAWALAPYLYFPAGETKDILEDTQAIPYKAYNDGEDFFMIGYMTPDDCTERMNLSGYGWYDGNVLEVFISKMDGHVICAKFWCGPWLGPVVILPWD